MESDEALAYMLLQEQPADDCWWTASSADKDDHMELPTVERQASNPFRTDAAGLQSLRVAACAGYSDGAPGCSSEPGSAKQSLHAGLPPQHPSSLPQLPSTGPHQPPSVFDQPAHQLSDFPQVKISFSKPLDAQHRKMPSTGSTGRKSRELSCSPSDCMENWHMPLQRSSGSINTSTTESHSTPSSMNPHQDEEPVPYVRPTVQTGMRTRGDLAPQHSGGKRVLKTAEERKQHRMAKNRATAAASRKRKQAAKEDLLSKLERMEQENAHLSQLLVSRDEEIAQMREQIGLAELIHTNTGDQDQIMSTHRGADHVFPDMIDLA